MFPSTSRFVSRVEVSNHLLLARGCVASGGGCLAGDGRRQARLLSGRRPDSPVPVPPRGTRPALLWLFRRRRACLGRTGPCSGHQAGPWVGQGPLPSNGRSFQLHPRLGPDPLVDHNAGLIQLRGPEEICPICHRQSKATGRRFPCPDTSSDGGAQDGLIRVRR